MMPVCRKKIKGSLTLEGQTGEGLEALGLRPKPGEGRCPFEPRQGGGPPPSQGQAWTRLIGVFEDGGAYTDVETSWMAPLLQTPQRDGIQGPALVGVEGAKPLVGSGAKPRGRQVPLPFAHGHRRRYGPPP